MSQPVQNALGNSDVVSFKVADQDFCIDIGAVREIRGWSPVTELPHAPAYVKGVVNLRGTVIAVIDLSDRLGFGRTDPQPRHVTIVVTAADQTIGLLADEVSDILTLDRASLQQVPDLATEVARDFVSDVATLEQGCLLQKLDLSRVLAGLGMNQP